MSNLDEIERLFLLATDTGVNPLQRVTDQARLGEFLGAHGGDRAVFGHIIRCARFVEEHGRITMLALETAMIDTTAAKEALAKLRAGGT